MSSNQTSLFQAIQEGNCEALWNASFSLRALFYLVLPKETTFATVEQVPNILVPAFPYFFIMLFFELIIATAKGVDVYSVADIITSVGAGLMSRLPDLFGRSIELAIYIWVYTNYSFYSFPVESIWTWIIAMFAVDFCYYWFHRASHELNFLWAFHQTHHSSEYMNLATALRQSVIQKYGSFIFYQPMALFVPPSIAIMHFQLNFLYQFWIHTEFIGKLGPLEWVLNTASHHRVHHGRNPYAVDKNYAGFLIIWDRMFGTFEAERDDEKVSFGLIHNVNSFDAFHVQVNHWYDIGKKLRLVWRSKKYQGVTRFINLLKAIFYGPGWFPSKPYLRMGDPKDLPQVKKDHVRYGHPMPVWLGIYCTMQFALLVVIFIGAVATLKQAEVGIKVYQPKSVALAAIIFASLCSLGYIFDRKWYSGYVEAARCVVLAVIAPRMGSAFNVPELWIHRLQVFFAVSLVIWVLGRLSSNRHSKETELKGKTE